MERKREGISDQDIEAAWSKEIKRRVAEIDAGTVELVPWEEVRGNYLAIHQMQTLPLRLQELLDIFLPAVNNSRPRPPVRSILARKLGRALSLNSG